MIGESTDNGQPGKQSSQGRLLLQDYVREIAPTDKLPQNSLSPVLMGLFGEVGSIMATAKKYTREDEAYAGYQQAVEEEFGDALWYFTTLCRRLGINVDSVFAKVVNPDKSLNLIAACDFPNGSSSHVSPVSHPPELDKALLNLGKAMTALLEIKDQNENTRDSLITFAYHYLQALQASQVSFSKISRMNIEKTCGRFLDPDVSTLPTFDSEFPDEERLPHHFEIKITQRKSGQSYLQWNDVFIGSPLTDSILDPDGYRFHDVFHFANAAILHWSPTFRGLIKQKRKSDPRYDEAEDGGRAIVVEEGLTAWIFSCAKHLNFFDSHRSISFDLLKTVKQFVQGYEVEKCPLKLWETAILKGYDVFRQVRDNNGGVIVGDRIARTIDYKPISGG